MEQDGAGRATKGAFHGFLYLLSKYVSGWCGWEVVKEHKSHSSQSKVEELNYQHLYYYQCTFIRVNPWQWLAAECRLSHKPLSYVYKNNHIILWTETVCIFSLNCQIVDNIVHQSQRRKVFTQIKTNEKPRTDSKCVIFDLYVHKCK